MVSEPIEVRDDGDASFTIIGTTRPGEKLEIVQDSNDPDGNGELSYQWQLSLDHGLSWNNISSVRRTSYTRQIEVVFYVL